MGCFFSVIMCLIVLCCRTNIRGVWRRCSEVCLQNSFITTTSGHLLLLSDFGGFLVKLHFSYLSLTRTKTKQSQLPACHRCFSAPHRFTCATPHDQPHLQLICQSAPVFRCRSMTDSMPDRLLRDARRLSVVFLPACSWSTQPIPDLPL